MASVRDRRGNAKNAPMSVPKNTSPDGDHFVDLAQFLAGKSSVTLKSNAKKGIMGHGPGDDLSDHPRVLNPPPGAIVRASIGESTSDPQNPLTIAYQVARGNFDIVPDKVFDKAKPHGEVWDEHNADRTAREIADMNEPAPGTLLAVMASQINEMQAEIAELRGKK